MKVSCLSVRSYITLLFFWSFRFFANGNVMQSTTVHTWLDPFDMLKYDPASQKMREPAQLENQTRNTELQAICHPVFKRFLFKLLNEIEKHGLSTDDNFENHYDAEIKLSNKMVTDIKRFLNNNDNWNTGALDYALSNVFINIKLRNYESENWHFEDTSELKIILKAFFCILLIVAMMYTKLWTKVSWVFQYKKMFAVCFFISTIWNWFYLYQLAVAENQANIVKLQNMSEKCTGLKRNDWMDNLKDWFRTTWTLQDDPCKQYYEVLFVNPILLVSPIKAFTMTITTLFTYSLKYLGDGIRELFISILKNLPVTHGLMLLLYILPLVLVLAYCIGRPAIHCANIWLQQGQRQDNSSGITVPLNNTIQRNQENANKENLQLLAGGSRRSYRSHCSMNPSSHGTRRFTLKGLHKNIRRSHSRHGHFRSTSQLAGVILGHMNVQM